MVQNYKDLGFKCGLEIHQQLDTNKLFCNCPSLVNDPHDPDTHIQRKLRAVVGETGVIDAAAKHETLKGHSFTYESSSTSSCLVEYDEEPPHLIDQNALLAVLQFSHFVHAKIIDEIQVMRKTVVDGSNVSGFQRTALVAMNGYIDTTKGRVSIPTICIEEEAAKKVSTTKDGVTYRLDRLGVPLIEIATDANIKDPEHAKEVASLLGMMLRSTGKVRRGLGSIRQDVNVSIKGGARTEIKGFQDLKSIPKVIEYEIDRQAKLIKKGDKLKNEVRKAEPDFTTTFLRPMPGSARLYPETDCLPVEVTPALLKKIEKVELITDKISLLSKKLSIPEELIAEILDTDFEIESLSSKNKNISPVQIATICIEVPKEMKSRLKIDPSSLTHPDFDEVLSKLNKNEISKEAVIEILSLKAQKKPVDYSKFKTMDVKEVEKIIKDIITKNKGAPPGALMGMCMKELRGKVDGKIVSDLVNKYA